MTALFDPAVFLWLLLLLLGGVGLARRPRWLGLMLIWGRVGTRGTRRCVRRLWRRNMAGHGCCW